jgi:hypothetical protein
MCKRILSRSLVIEAKRRKGTDMTSLITSISAQRSEELRSYAASRRRANRARRRDSRQAGSAAIAEHVSLRRLDPIADFEALHRLAGRDSAAAPAGAILGAELDGRLIAALSLDSGELVADPFVPTDAVVERLRERADRLRHDGHRRIARRHGFHLTLRPRRG